MKRDKYVLIMDEETKDLLTLACASLSVDCEKLLDANFLDQVHTVETYVMKRKVDQIEDRLYNLDPATVVGKK